MKIKEHKIILKGVGASAGEIEGVVRIIGGVIRRKVVLKFGDIKVRCLKI